MKLFNILALSLYAVDAARKDNFDNNRNEELTESDQQKEWKKTCKKSIKNKEESDKFAEKMEKCMQKKAEKHAKRAQKADDRAKRVVMKQEVKVLKEEKSAIKAERNLCKAKCSQLANQVTKQNCLDYWKTVTRERIEDILGDIMDKKNPAERSNDEHCLTESGLTGTESTCKDQSILYCDSLGLDKPSHNIRMCKSDCINSCMEGQECTWTLDG